jgi:metallopeptidase MepB
LGILQPEDHEKGILRGFGRNFRVLPIGLVTSGMMRTLETIFSLWFVELLRKDRDKVSSSGKGIDIVWHEDVQVYAVWDSDDLGGAFLGYLHLDMFSRKSPGAGSWSVEPV